MCRLMLVLTTFVLFHSSLLAATNSFDCVLTSEHRSLTVKVALDIESRLMRFTQVLQDVTTEGFATKRSDSAQTWQEFQLDSASLFFLKRPNEQGNIVESIEFELAKGGRRFICSGGDAR